MNRTLLAFALSLIAGLMPLYSQTLSEDRQARLDGHYAGIRQKHINSILAAGGQVSRAKTIQEETDYINQLRKRWASTKYRAEFERGLADEMTPRPGERPSSPIPEPFQLSVFAKVVLAGLGYWVGKKLWKSGGGHVKAVPVDPRSLQVELSAGEKAQLAEAEKEYAERKSEIERSKKALQDQIQKLTGEVATLSGQADAAANAMVAQASTALNQAVAEYRTFLASMEQRFPVALAPWSNELWVDFAREPKQETLTHARYAQMDEVGLLPGETGITSPNTVPLLSAKGAIIVKTDAASKAKSRSAIQNIVLRAAIASPAEVRFSLVDPMGLGSAFPMRSLLPRVRPSARTAADELAEIVDDIRRINEAVVGQAESFAGLPREKRAGEVFEIIVALDYPRAYERDPRALEYLARIGQSGARAGRHLILEWDGAPTPAELARFEPHETVNAAGAASSVHYDAVPSPEQQRTLLNAVAAIKSRSTGGDWNSQVRPDALFAGSSARMVETPVGERLRLWFGDNQDGKPCAHAMLAGQTGSGKSFLLHVFITGLAARYSPAELKLVLVDGKQGVEFEAYKNLPHAQVVCLRTSPAIARSVLEDFVAEMEDRYVKFQQQSVTKLEDYRRKTGLPMPRMLMVVDEYQQLLEGDSDRGAQMLSRVLEKGRAAGIHLVLGSQTFEVRGLAASAMTHVHLRAALSLPIDYIQSLTAFGPEGKKLIRDLAPSGQAVINDESGRDGANGRGAVARLDAASGCSLPQVVAEIVKAAPAGPKAVVLSGNDAAVLADNPFVRQWKSQPPDAAALQTVARQSLREGGFGLTAWSAADRPLPLWLGRKFDVHGHLVAPLRRAAGHNLMVLGSDTAVRLCMLANGLAALRAMRPMADCDILLLDGLSDGQPGAGMLSAALDVLRDAGARVERAGPDGAVAALEQFAAAAMQPRNPEAVRILILSEPEYFPALASPAGFGPPPPGPSRTFKELLRAGPALGSHTIVTASGIGAFSAVAHPSRDAALFSHRVVQQSNEEESMTLFSNLAATRIMSQTDHHMAAMYVDTVQGIRAAQLFKSYAASPNIYGDQSTAGLAEALRALYGAGRP